MEGEIQEDGKKRREKKLTMVGVMEKEVERNSANSWKGRVRAWAKALF